MKLLVASPACCPRKTLPQALAFFQAIGFTYLEVFTDWVESRFDFSQPPSDYRSQCEAQGLRVYSMHLPRVDSVAGVDDAVRYAQAAVELGASVIIYKAHTLDTYRETLGTFLDRTQSLGLTTVITHHAGTAIEHPEHMRSLLEAVDDARLHGLLEVGHLAKAGYHWRDAWTYLQGRLGLVHIKDMRDGHAVPYGQGTIDFGELFATLTQGGYTDPYVFEQEHGDLVSREQHVGPGVAHLREHFDCRLS